jgi:hypothetical protein
MTLVSKSFSSDLISLNTHLEAIAVRLYFPIKLTICNIYLRGLDTITINDLDGLISQLDPPFIITGDFNACNIIWGSQSTDSRGKMIEELMNKHDLAVLNRGNPTHFSHRFKSFSAIDVTLASPRLQSYFEWYVEEDLYNSDHFPVIMPTLNNYPTTQFRERWLVDRADWMLYQFSLDFSNLQISSENIDLSVEKFTDIIKTSANSSIPKSGTSVRKKCVPWWNNEIAIDLKEKRKLFRKFRRTLGQDDMKTYLIAKQKLRKLIRDAKKESLMEFLSNGNL